MDCNWSRFEPACLSDQGIEGVVIRLGEGLDPLGSEKHKVRVGSGYPLIKLSTLLSRQGLAGLSLQAVFQGSVGGAVYMNAGAHKSDISSVLSKALILFEDSAIDWLTNKELEFSYRASVLQTETSWYCFRGGVSITGGET